MSGIYIKGMEMPQPKFADMVTVYDAYILVNPNGRAVIVVDDEDGLNSPEYTLTSVPPHGRLIDADALCEGLVSNHEVVIYAKTAPTIIPADEVDT